MGEKEERPGSNPEDREVAELLGSLDRDLSDTDADCSYFHNRIVDLVDAVERRTRARIRDKGEFVGEDAPIENGRFISRSMSVGREALLYADCDLRIVPEAALNPEEYDEDDC